MNRIALGCSALVLVLAGCEHPPRLPTAWAGSARETVSGATPNRDEARDPVAEWGPEEERERDDLTSLDGEEGLGRVEARLGAGVFVLESEVRIEETSTFVLRGDGPHRTRLELDSDSLRSLTVRKVGRVELRGLTIAGYTGGGVFLKDCPDVVVEDVHFAGSRVGLSIEGSVARIGSSVFAGCQDALQVRDSKVAVRETAFQKCWRAVICDSSSLDVEASAFLENRTVVDGKLDARSRFVGNLLSGQEQDLGWEGRPKLASANLAPERDVGDRLGTFTNRRLHTPEDFPDRTPVPDGFDLVAVHLAVLRATVRGERDPVASVAEVRRQRAEAYALACQRTLRGSDLTEARRQARVAVRYLGTTDLTGAPEAVVAIADLAN